jgi:acetate kinase
MVMAGDLLTLNAGSCLKFSLWHCWTGIELRELFRSEVEKIGIAPHLRARGPSGDTVIDKNFSEGSAKLTHEDLLRELFAWISQQCQNAIEAIGHRVVHGGSSFTAPVRIDDRVMQKRSWSRLRRCISRIIFREFVLARSWCRTCLRSRASIPCFITRWVPSRVASACRARMTRRVSDDTDSTVIPTDEERMIAGHTVKHIGQAALLN